LVVSFSVWTRILITKIANKKRIFVVKKYFIVLLFLISGITLSFGQSQKIGYVDSQVILNQLPEAIKAQSDLDALTNTWSSQLDSMKQAYQQAIANYQKQQASMPEDQKASRQKDIVAMEQAMYTFQQDKFGQPNGAIYQKQEEIFTPVKQKIYAAIGTVAKEEGMQFVFDKSGDIILLYADATFDVTYKVLDKLKRGN
jgi:outer membrane protein